MIRYNFKAYAKYIISETMEIFIGLVIIFFIGLAIGAVDISQTQNISAISEFSEFRNNIGKATSFVASGIKIFICGFGFLFVAIGIFKLFTSGYDDSEQKKSSMLMICVGIVVVGSAGIILSFLGDDIGSTSFSVSFDYDWFWQKSKNTFVFILISFFVVMKIELIYLYFKAKKVKNIYYLLNLFIEIFIIGKDMKKYKYFIVPQELIDSGFDLKSCGKNLAKYFVK